MGLNSGINSHFCEDEYKTYCLEGGECYHLVDEDIVGLGVHDCLEENALKVARNGVRLDFHNGRG